MPNVGQQQANYFPRDMMSPPSHIGPRQPHNRAPQNHVVPPAAYSDQPEGHLENAQPVRGVAGPPHHQLHDPHHIDVAYYGLVDYHPPPLRVRNFHLSST